MPTSPSAFTFLPLALFVLAQSSSPAANSSFTIDQVMSAPFATHLLAAPRGSQVVWLLDQQGRRNVWTAGAPEWNGHSLTHFDQDDGQEIDELSWTPDAHRLFFTRGGDFETHRDNPNPALSPAKPEQAIWSVDLSGPALKKLAPGHAPAVSPTGDLVAFLRAGQIFIMKLSGEDITCVVNEKAAADLRWSPDGTRLAFVSERPDHSLIGVYDFRTKTLSYLDPGVDRDTHPVWSPDGNRIAYIRIPARLKAFAFGPERSGEPWSIRVADLETGSALQAFRAQDGPGSVFYAAEGEQQLFWAAGDRLIFPWERTGWCHLYSVPARGGLANELTPGQGEVADITISRDARTIFYAADFIHTDPSDTDPANADRRHLWRIDLSNGKRPQMVTRGESIEWQPTPVADGSALVFLAAGYNQKAHAMVQNSAASPKPLAPQTIPVDFPGNLLVKPQPVLITAADGLQIHGQLFSSGPFSSSKDNTQPRPALIFFHGGSRRQMLLGFHYMAYYSNAYALEQYFANQGYLVLSVNYRSGTGYGLDFREALHYGATGASEFNDVIGAGLYLRSRSDVDPKRIGVWGGSYGGYLTALALARASDLFAAGVDFHGVHDWNLEIQNFVPSYDPQTDVDVARIAFESSPLASVKTWKSPVLLIHGDDDRNVPFVETLRLVQALRQQHVPFDLLVFPNEIHAFLLYRHWVEAYKATADFFAKKLMPTTESPQTR